MIILREEQRMSFISYCQLHCFKDHVYLKYMALVGCISVANHNWSYEHARSEKCQIEKQNKEPANRNRF